MSFSRSFLLHLFLSFHLFSYDHRFSRGLFLDACSCDLSALVSACATSPSCVFTPPVVRADVKTHLPPVSRLPCTTSYCLIATTPFLSAQRDRFRVSRDLISAVGLQFLSLLSSPLSLSFALWLFIPICSCDYPRLFVFYLQLQIHYLSLR